MNSVVNSCFVAFFLPSSGLTLAIYFTLYGLCQIKPLDGGMYVTKKQLIFGFTPLPWVQISIAHSIFIYVSLWFQPLPFCCLPFWYLEIRSFLFQSSITLKGMDCLIKCFEHILNKRSEFSSEFCNLLFQSNNSNAHLRGKAV